MPRLNVLVLAPPSDLPDITAEIAAIHRCHNTKVLTGFREIDIAHAITDAVETSESFDCIWIVGHGDENGIQCNGFTMSIQSLVQYVKVCEMRLCVLNTCSSENIARNIAINSDADVICTIGGIDGQVGNQDAIRLGIFLAEELASEQTFREAFEIVAPPGGPYRYYQARDSDFIPTRRTAPLEEMYEIRGDVKVMKAWLIALSIAVLLLVVLFIAMWLRVEEIFRMLLTIRPT